MKDKSICSQVFDLLEKETSLPQIVIKVDISPEEAMSLQEKYLIVTKRGKIIHLLKDKKDMALTIEILEFLKVYPEYWKKIIEIRDLEIIISNLKADRNDIEKEIWVNKILCRHYEGQIQIKEKQLALPSNY